MAVDGVGPNSNPSRRLHLLELSRGLVFTVSDFEISAMKQHLLNVIAWEEIGGGSCRRSWPPQTPIGVAVHPLDPNLKNAVLVIGCGPGVEASVLAKRLSQNRVLVTDRLSVMVRPTPRRIRRAGLSPSVEVPVRRPVSDDQPTANKMTSGGNRYRAKAAERGWICGQDR